MYYIYYIVPYDYHLYTKKNKQKKPQQNKTKTKVYKTMRVNITSFRTPLFPKHCLHTTA